MIETGVSERERSGVFKLPLRDYRVLIVDSDAQNVRRLQQILRSVSLQPETTDSLANVETLREYDIAIVNYDRVATKDREARAKLYAASTQTRILVISEGGYDDDVMELMGERVLKNLIAKNETVDPGDLIVTVQKILRKDIFGLEKYFVWGVEPTTLTLRRSSHREKLLDFIEEYTDAIGIQRRLAELLRTVADELVANALYNAPVDANGNRRYAHLSRTEEVVLDEQESVVVQVCCDGRRLGISAMDPFGSLAKETLMEYLAKCSRKGSDQVDQKAGGAGLGLYFVFDALSHFIVNIHAGVRTELVGLIDIGGGYRDFASKIKSFNIFWES